MKVIRSTSPAAVIVPESRSPHTRVPSTTGNGNGLRHSIPRVYDPVCTREVDLIRTVYVPLSGKVNAFWLFALNAATCTPDGAKTVAWARKPATPAV